MPPKFDLEVIGTKKRKKITALVDTGFSGFLCLPSKVAYDLGLELIGVDEVELGDGQCVTQFMFSGKVNFLDKLQEIEIVLTNSETAQLGTQLMGDCQLSIDFLENKVSLIRKDI